MLPQTTITEKTRENQERLEILSETIIQCPDCKVPLLLASKVGEDDSRQVIQALHKNCNSKSYIKTLLGKQIISPAKNATILDFLEEKHTIIVVQTC